MRSSGRGFVLWQRLEGSICLDFLHKVAVKLGSDFFLMRICLIIIIIIIESDLHTQHGPLTHDLEIKSPMLSQLIQPGVLSLGLILIICGFWTMFTQMKDCARVDYLVL